MSTTIPHPLHVPGAARRAWATRLALHAIAPLLGAAALIALLRTGWSHSTFALLCAALLAQLAVIFGGRLVSWWAWTETPGAYSPGATMPTRVAVERIPLITGIIATVALAAQVIATGSQISAGQIDLASDPRGIAWLLTAPVLALTCAGTILRRAPLATRAQASVLLAGTVYTAALSGTLLLVMVPLILGSCGAALWRGLWSTRSPSRVTPRPCRDTDSSRQG